MLRVDKATAHLLLLYSQYYWFCTLFRLDTNMDRGLHCSNSVPETVYKCCNAWSSTSRWNHCSTVKKRGTLMMAGKSYAEGYSASGCVYLQVVGLFNFLDRGVSVPLQTGHVKKQTIGYCLAAARCGAVWLQWFGNCSQMLDPQTTEQCFQWFLNKLCSVVSW